MEEGKKIVRRRSCSFGRNVEELQNGKLVGFPLPYFVRFPVLAFRLFFFFEEKLTLKSDIKENTGGSMVC